MADNPYVGPRSIKTGEAFWGRDQESSRYASLDLPWCAAKKLLAERSQSRALLNFRLTGQYEIVWFPKHRTSGFLVLTAGRKTSRCFLFVPCLIRGIADHPQPRMMNTLGFFPVEDRGLQQLVEFRPVRMLLETHRDDRRNQVSKLKADVLSLGDSK